MSRAWNKILGPIPEKSTKTKKFKVLKAGLTSKKNTRLSFFFYFKLPQQLRMSWFCCTVRDSAFEIWREVIYIHFMFLIIVKGLLMLFFIKLLFKSVVKFSFCWDKNLLELCKFSKILILNNAMYVVHY